MGVPKVTAMLVAKIFMGKELDDSVVKAILDIANRRSLTVTILCMIDDIYGFEVSEGFVSDVTDKILPKIEEWQKRPLSEVYPIIFIDAIHFNVRENGSIKKMAA